MFENYFIKSGTNKHDKLQTVLKKKTNKQKTGAFFNHSQLGLKRPLIFCTDCAWCFAIAVYSHMSYKPIFNYQTTISDDLC